MSKNLTIKTRLVFVIAFLSLQLVVGAVIGIVSLGFANQSMETIFNDRLVPTAQLDEVARRILDNELNIAKALTATPEKAAKLMDGIAGNIGRIDTVWAEYMATYLTEEEKVLAGKFAESRAKFLSEGLRPAVAAIRAGDVARATEILHGPMESSFEPVREGIDALIRLQLEVAKKEHEASTATYELVRNSCIAAVVFGILLAAAIGVWLIRSISRPLDHAVRIAGAVAAGDLTQKIEVASADETGKLMQALKDMNASLVRIVGEVRTGTDTIATASGQISAGNHDLSSRTEQQASSLEETASSMEELTTTVRQNADNARQANQLAETASETAVRGGRVVSQVVDTMDSINEASRRVVDIIGVIDSIAFQTNILALNAAVEAARAGEQGRGFAVVATEVRSLAQRSAAAAKEIKGLIDASVERVDAGSKLVAEAGSTMDEVVESVRRVADIMAEIRAASQEQSAGIEQVNQAIGQMDQVTQQNASLVEEAAAAAESLQKQAANLAQAVSVFKLHGAAPVVARPAPAVAAPRSVQPPLAPRPAVKVAPPAPRREPVATAGGDWEEF